MNLLKRLIANLVVFAVIYAVGAVILHPRFIYPFDQTPFAQAGFEAQDIGVEGAPIFVGTAPGDGPAVLYLMGNAGSLALFSRALEIHRAAGRYVVGLEYPGGAGRPGEPSEALIKSQALAAYDWLDAQTDAPIVLHGYSLGTSVALYVASERDPAGIVLDAPFARMCEQMARRSQLPACWLPGVQKWDSLALASEIDGPVLIQHGVEDTLALLNDGARLAEALRAADVEVAFYPVDGGTHTNLIDGPDYERLISEFIADVMQ